MAQNEQASQDGSNATTIARVGKRKRGYDVDQVNTFLEHAHTLYDDDSMALKRSDIQDASFDIARGGYSIPQVDATLERLGQAVTDKQTTYDIHELGRVAWKAQMEAQYNELKKHADRAAGARFAPGAAHTPSYDRRQVDHLIDDVMRSAQMELRSIATDDNSAPAQEELPVMTAKSVEDMAFTQRRGDHGYDERQVDYYLNACVSLLGSLESYKRIAAFAKPTAQDKTPAHAASATVTAPEVSAPTATVPTHDHADAQPPSIAPTSSSITPAVSEQDQSFDEVSRAEQAIFAQVQETTTIPAVASNDDAPTATQQATQPEAPVETAVVEAETVAIEPVGSAETDTSSAAGSHTPVIAEVKHARTLSDIAPITPAPRTIPAHELKAAAQSQEEPSVMPAVPSVSAVSDETTITMPDTPIELNSPSLAALASLAESTREPVESTAQSAGTTTTGIQPLSVPKLGMTLPDLPSLQVPAPASHAVPESASQADTSSSNDEQSTTDAKKADKPAPVVSSAFQFTQDGMDVDIPDLSFPTISTDEPLIVDNKPNEKLS